MRKPDQLSLFPSGECGDIIAETEVLDHEVIAAPAPGKADIEVTHSDSTSIDGAPAEEALDQEGRSLGSRSTNSSVGSLVKLSDRVVAYLTADEVAAYLGISVPTVWRWARVRADFPKPHHLGPRVTQWRRTDITALNRLIHVRHVTSRNPVFTVFGTRLPQGGFFFTIA